MKAPLTLLRVSHFTMFSVSNNLSTWDLQLNICAS